nr:hypothetical protein [Mesorhizobium sp.]
MRMLFAAASLALATLPSAYADDRITRHELTDEVSAAYYAEQFDELDRMAERFRADDQRTESGLWKLTIFYHALDNPTSLNQTEGPPSLLELEDRKERAMRWIVAKPQSPAAHIAYASSLYKIAWYHRGTRYVSETKPAQLRSFQENSMLALEHLYSNKEVASVDPAWYATAIRIATTQGWPEYAFIELYDEGATRHPYYYDIYFNALTRTYPEWGGSVEAIDRLIQDAVERTGERDGDIMYARAYWVVSDVRYGPTLFRSTLADWPKLKRAFGNMLKQYPDQWNFNRYYRFACDAVGEARFEAEVRYAQELVPDNKWYFDPDYCRQLSSAK